MAYNVNTFVSKKSKSVAPDMFNVMALTSNSNSVTHKQNHSLTLSKGHKPVIEKHC